MTAGVPVAIAVVALLIVPSAVSNAFWRWLVPWRNIERYTFARIESLPERLVVPIAEPSELKASLRQDSRWNPTSGAAWVGSHKIQSQLQEGSYDFELPPLKDETEVKLSIGDVRKKVIVEPQPRPELVGLSATIDLPAYLQRTDPLQRDIRGGTLSVAKGSQVTIAAEASRDLAAASLDGTPVSFHGDTVLTSPAKIEESRVVSLQWRDAMGLSAKTPLRIKIRAADDQAPTISCRELDPQVVLMVKDVLAFQVDASDDFGVRTVGMEWKGTPSLTSEAEPAVGEKVIYAGNPEAEDVPAITATFSPQFERIAPKQSSCGSSPRTTCPTGHESILRSTPFTS